MTGFTQGWALFFKRLFLFTFCFTLTACGLKVGESPAPEGEVPLGGYSCVNQISEKASLYFEGRLEDAEIASFMDCLKKSVSDFPKRMRADNGFYAPEALMDFINRIAKGRQLTPALLEQFMKIKQTFVGGRVDRISRSDLAAALGLIDDLKQAALILRPHMKVFNPKLGAQIPPEKIALELDQASEALTEASRIFLVSLRKTERPYSLKDFEKFLTEFRSFINWNDVFPSARSPKDWVELIASAKEISTGGDRYEIQKGEWEAFLSLSRSAYIAFLKVKYGVVGQNLWADVGLKNLVHVVDQVRDEVIRVISSRKNRLLPKEEVTRLLQSIEGLGWMPFGLSAKTASDALELIATKILDGGFQGTFPGFRVQHVLKAADEFESWASTQNYISKQVVAPKDDKKAPQVFISSITDQSVSSPKEEEFVPVGWVEFRKFLSSRRPLFLPNSYLVNLDYAGNLNKNGVEFDLHNLSATHLFYRVLKLVFESYGRRDEAGDFRLSGPALQQFYTDFFSLGVALGWLDSRSTTAGSRSYVEGNLFTYDSDGIGNQEYGMNLSEGVDLIAYLLTAGKITDRLYEGFSSCQKGPVDFRGDAKVLRSCVEGELVPQLEKVLTMAPALKAWVKTLNSEEAKKYSHLLLQSAFSQAHSDEKWVEKSELSTLAVVVLYSESVMTRYDGNHDGTLSDEEVDQAFPIFRDFINSLALRTVQNSWVASYLLMSGDQLTDDALHSIFEFILFFKRAPQSSSDLMSVYWNARPEPGWVINSDRMDLTEAFSVIINGLLNPQTAPE